MNRERTGLTSTVLPCRMWALPAPVPEALTEAADALEGKARVGIVDCRRRMPSGRTLAESLKLVTTVSPTLFRVANGARPVQIMPAVRAHDTSRGLPPTGFLTTARPRHVPCRSLPPWWRTPREPLPSRRRGSTVGPPLMSLGAECHT